MAVVCETGWSSKGQACPRDWHPRTPRMWRSVTPARCLVGLCWMCSVGWIGVFFRVPQVGMLWLTVTISFSRVLSSSSTNYAGGYNNGTKLPTTEEPHIPSWNSDRNRKWARRHCICTVKILSKLIFLIAVIHRRNEKKKIHSKQRIVKSA